MIFWTLDMALVLFVVHCLVLQVKIVQLFKKVIAHLSSSSCTI